MTGSGTQADPFIISNVTDLQAMEDNLSAYYELANDIDASATSGWNAGLGFDPIGDNVTPFTGSFDGKNYSITDLFIARPAIIRIGLFGKAIGSLINNVTIINCDITGKHLVGALLGACWDGDVSNCHSSGSVAADVWDDAGGLIGLLTEEGICTRSSSSCSVSGQDFVGGLIGQNNNGEVTRSYATGAVTGTRYYAGGFVGETNGGPISDCYARGNVTGVDYVGGFAALGEKISNSYSTGIVNGASSVGGFVGEKSEATITNSFWDTETSGQATSDGGTGKTTAQMKSIVTFQAAEWAITTIWNISPTCVDGYPCLIGVNPCCPSFVNADSSIAEKRVAFEAIRNLEIVYGGRFFVDKSGNAVYQSRYHRNV